MQSTYFTIIALSVLLASNPLSAKENKTVIHWTTEVWPHVSTKNGTGAYFDLLKAIYSESEFELIHKFLPYKRGEHYVKNGQMDLFSMCLPMTGFQQAKYAWSQETLGVLFDTDVVTNWLGKESLSGKNISLHKELDVLPFVQSIRAHFFKTEIKSRALQLLNQGRTDFFLDIHINIKEQLKDTSPLSYPRYTFRPLQVITCTPGFTDSDKGKYLSQIWDEGIIRLHRNGELQTIFQKWQLEYPAYSFLSE